MPTANGSVYRPCQTRPFALSARSLDRHGHHEREHERRNHRPDEAPRAVADREEHQRTDGDQPDDGRSVRHERVIPTEPPDHLVDGRPVGLADASPQDQADPPIEPGLRSVPLPERLRVQGPEQLEEAGADDRGGPPPHRAPPEELFDAGSARNHQQDDHQEKDPERRERAGEAQHACRDPESSEDPRIIAGPGAGQHDAVRPRRDPRRHLQAARVHDAAEVQHHGSERKEEAERVADGPEPGDGANARRKQRRDDAGADQAHEVHLSAARWVPVAPDTDDRRVQREVPSGVGVKRRVSRATQEVEAARGLRGLEREADAAVLVDARRGHLDRGLALDVFADEVTARDRRGVHDVGRLVRSRVDGRRDRPGHADREEEEERDDPTQASRLGGESSRGGYRRCVGDD